MCRRCGVPGNRLERALHSIDENMSMVREGVPGIKYNLFYIISLSDFYGVCVCAHHLNFSGPSLVPSTCMYVCMYMNVCMMMYV
jgi:hypothetical protein